VAVDLDALLANAEQLPSPPAVALEMLQIVQRPDCDVDRVAEILSRDPALVAKILRIANTPLFGARKVTTIRHALMTIGLKAIHVLALSFSLMRPPESAGVGFDWNAWWRGALASAVAARHLAMRGAPRLTDEAFVAGLLLDLGALAVRMAWPERADRIAQAVAAGAMQDAAERAELDLSQPELGAHLLERWGLPQSIVLAVRHHRQPEALTNDVAEPVRQLTRLVEHAAVVARCLRHDPRGDDTALARELAWLQERHLGEPDAARRRDAVAELLREVRSGVDQACGAFELGKEAPARLLELQQKTHQLLIGLALGMSVRIDSLESRQATLEQLATTDGLTGLLNRRSLDERFGALFDAARGRGGPLAVVMIDLDHFKRVNDTHGHQIGDELLQAVGRALGGGVRAGELFVRYGGEEFCGILPDGEASSVCARAEALRAAIAGIRLPLPGGAVLLPSASLGVAVVNDARMLARKELLLEAADRALYSAKRAGRNRVVLEHAAVVVDPLPESAPCSNR
jgi:diguanylate cyclase (GGDEF)-like protein